MTKLHLRVAHLFVDYFVKASIACIIVHEEYVIWSLDVFFSQ